MTTAPSGPRPSVVTWGAAAGVIAGGLLVANSFDALSRLRSLDSASVINNALSQLGGTSTSFGGAVSFLHGAYIGIGAASGLAAVLAAYAYFGNRLARAALAPVAGVLFVVTASLGWTLGIAMAAVLGLLWSPPARAWYSGRPVEALPAPTTAAQPRFESFGAQRTRPRAVGLAVAITWVVAGVSIAGSVYEGLQVATSSSYVAQFEQRLPSFEQIPHAETWIRAAMIAGVVIAVVLALVEIVVALFVLQGNRIARIVLTVFAGIGIIGSLLSLPAGLIVMAPWILVLTLLYSPDSKAWFEQIRRDRESR